LHIESSLHDAPARDAVEPASTRASVAVLASGVVLASLPPSLPTGGGLPQ
jgi:hypothetical protein